MLARIKQHIRFAYVFLRNLVGCSVALLIIMAAVAYNAGVTMEVMFSWEEMSGGVKTCILLALTFLPYGLTLWETDEEKPDV